MPPDHSDIVSERFESFRRAADAAEAAGVVRPDALVEAASRAEALTRMIPGTSPHVEAIGRLAQLVRTTMVDAVIGWDAEVGWAYDGALSPQAWLASHLGLRKGEAYEYVAVAKFCRSFPEALAALHGELAPAGAAPARLSFEQLLIWSRVVTVPRMTVFREHAAEVLSACVGLSLPDTTTCAQKWAQYADDLLDRGKPDDRYDRRGLRYRQLDDGMVEGRFVLDPHGAGLMQAYLDANDRPDADDHPGGPRTREQRHADLLVELFRRANGRLLEHGSGRIAEPTHHVLGFTQLDDPSGLGQTPDGVVLDRGLMELYACTAFVSRIRLDAKGEVLDLGRATRLFTAAQRKAIIGRDRHCQFPGCDARTSWCDVHHVEHWEHGGTTDLANGVLICHQHHRLLHHRGWALQRCTDGTGWWLDRHPARPPDGRRRPPGIRPDEPGLDPTSPAHHEPGARPPVRRIHLRLRPAA